jgi:hypothetical protein
MSTAKTLSTSTGWLPDVHSPREEQLRILNSSNKSRTYKTETSQLSLVTLNFPGQNGSERVDSQQLIPPSSALSKSEKRKREQSYLQTVLLEGPAMAKPSPKQQLCIDLLTQGFVHSYVDFFYLTQEYEKKAHNSSRSSPPNGGM